MGDNHFHAEEKKAFKTGNENFFLHSHDEYEIYMFLDGDTVYIVEDKSYTLSPGDVVIIRKNEMHRVFHNGKKPYHRIILMVSPEFFKKHSCEEYEKVFLGNTFDGSNKITSLNVKSSGLYDAIMRLKEYTDNFADTSSPVAAGIVTEILYLINKVSFSEIPSVKGALSENVIAYINANLTCDLSLDNLAEKFFVSKYHLCHTFKKSTGLTVREYITQKRLMLANEHIKDGRNLSTAASLSGFGDYSSFYRGCAKYNKSAPRESMQKNKK